MKYRVVKKTYNVNKLAMINHLEGIANIFLIKNTKELLVMKNCLRHIIEILNNFCRKKHRPQKDLNS